mmetsp:Transcript_55638/g.146813  ORF Transcript_55638/g.146813 Transcript_55638/m.146813 type:complete len:100 (-) Transcript_55638:958-1257(-)
MLSSVFVTFSEMRNMNQEPSTATTTAVATNAILGTGGGDIQLLGTGTEAKPLPQGNMIPHHVLLRMGVRSIIGRFDVVQQLRTPAISRLLLQHVKSPRP